MVAVKSRHVIHDKIQKSQPSEPLSPQTRPGEHPNPGEVSRKPIGLVLLPSFFRSFLFFFAALWRYFFFWLRCTLLRALSNFVTEKHRSDVSHLPRRCIFFLHAIAFCRQHFSSVLTLCVQTGACVDCAMAVSQLSVRHLFALGPYEYSFTQAFVRRFHGPAVFVSPLPCHVPSSLCDML